MVGLSLIVFIAVGWLTNLEKGFASASVFAVFAIIIQTKSEARSQSLKERKFWVAIGIMAAFHAIALAFIDFPEFKFGLVILPFALVDGFVMWWTISYIEKLFVHREKDGGLQR
jgi:hypothetical protein